MTQSTDAEAVVPTLTAVPPPADAAEPLLADDECEPAAPLPADAAPPITEPGPDPAPAVKKWTDPQRDWPHLWRMFEGDRLAVRKPTEQALAALSLATNEFSTDRRRTKYLTLFIQNHTAEASLDRVYDRMMDPDDPKYTKEAVTEFLQAITGTDPATD